jgi:hypothetical protein
VVTAGVDASGVNLVPLPQTVIETCAKKYMIVPPVIGLDDWEAVAAPYQDRITREARSDIERDVAAERPDSEVPQNWRQPQVYRPG